MAEIEDAGNVAIPPSYYAERFMTEFNENSVIFLEFLLPWVNEIALAIPVIYQHSGRIKFLSTSIGRLRDQVRNLEDRADDLEEIALAEGNNSTVTSTGDTPEALAGETPNINGHIP